ncbi:MAG: hypothetical protein Q8N60_04730, partial [Candidatus Diapherotrites archaeon]|nr:hypothetical protein [Candidatus Diapherotrites archaeon]
REAGRMLRKAGAKGFIVYPNALNMKESYGKGKQGYDYWLAHAQEMIAGFKEGADYVERNKIRNPDFEAFKAKTGDYTCISLSCSLVGETQFAPVFWLWKDSDPSYIDNETYSDLVYDNSLQEYLTAAAAQEHKNFAFTDVKSGSVAWKHSRKGEPGTRTILSRELSIGAGEKGNYEFSIWTKASIDSANSTIEFYLVNTNTREAQELGYTGFAKGWAEFKKDIDITAGDYNVKIILNDQTGQSVDVFLDNASLEKAEAQCGNSECETELGETFAICPQDCQECVDTPTLMNQYIPQWKSGEISMLTLMQKIRQRNAGTGCPPALCWHCLI